MARTEEVTDFIVGWLILPLAAVGLMIMVAMGLVIPSRRKGDAETTRFPPEPHNPTAIVFCPQSEPFRPDKWELREGRLIVLIEGSYVITPSSCSLIADLNTPSAQVASK